MKLKFLFLSGAAMLFLASCGGENTGSGETAELQKVNAVALVNEFCDCISTAEDIDICADMAANHVVSLAGDSDGMEIYAQQTEACAEKRQAQDEEKAMDELDTMVRDDE